MDLRESGLCFWAAQGTSPNFRGAKTIERDLVVTDQFVKSFYFAQTLTREFCDLQSSALSFLVPCDYQQ